MFVFPRNAIEVPSSLGSSGWPSVVSQDHLRTTPQAPTLRPTDRSNVLHELETAYKRDSD